MTKLYSIFAFIEGDWREYNGIEYTKKEADKELRHLKKIAVASLKRSASCNVKP